MRMHRRFLAFSILTLTLLAASCGSDDSSDTAIDSDATVTSTTATSVPPTEAPTTVATTTPPAEPAPTDPPVTEPAGGEGCWVHLYEEDDFDTEEADDHFRLTEPGRYANLDRLPGASDEWTDEAESIRVGPAATVTLWDETDFQGESIQLGPGSERAELDEEPESLELAC